MRYISIQKKPTLWGELLMVFIISLYGLYQYKALMVRLFLQKCKIYFNKTNGI